MEATTSLNTKINYKEKEEFKKNVEALGMTPSAAIKVFVRVFNEYKGFPFPVRQTNHIHFDSPDLPVAKIKDGVVIAPSSWRDEEDED